MGKNNFLNMLFTTVYVLQPKSKTIHRRETIYDLKPETTYCLKVQARITSERKVGSFSPVYCIKTTDQGNE